MLAFQLAELDGATLRADYVTEDADLASTKQVLASAERVQRLCAESYAALYESDGAVLFGVYASIERPGVVRIGDTFAPA